MTKISKCIDCRLTIVNREIEKCHRCGNALNVVGPQYKRHHTDSFDDKELQVIKASAREFRNPKRTDIVAVTAISPKRHSLQRQQECIDSWQRFGLSVYARNTKEEIEKFKRHFPNVTFIADEEMCVGYAFPTQRISHLAKTAMEIDCPVLLINSDCQLRGPSDWLAFDEQNQFVGVRWNYDAGNPYSVSEFRWGLDAFSFTPDQASLLPADFPFGIGHPVWDYAVPAVMRHHGIALHIPHRPFIFHENHAVNWNKQDWHFGQRWMKDRLGVSIEWGEGNYRENLEPKWRYSKTRWVRKHHAVYKPPPQPSNLGDELHKTLKWAKLINQKKCGCDARRRELNRWPIERCESSVPQIVEMVRQGAEELGLPFSAWLAEKLVRRAIRRVKRQ